MLYNRKIVPPIALIAFAILGTVALYAIDGNIAANDPYPLPSGLRADFRLTFNLSGVAGMLWIAVLVILAHLARVFEVVTRTIMDRTERPRAWHPVVGTASVKPSAEPDTEQLPRVSPPDVVELPSPETVAALRRLAAKVTRANEG